MTYKIKRHRFRDFWSEVFDNLEEFSTTLADMEHSSSIRILADVNNQIILQDLEYNNIVILKHTQCGDTCVVELEEVFKIETNKKHTIKTDEGVRTISRTYHGQPDVLNICEQLEKKTKLKPFMFMIQMNMLKYVMRLGHKDSIEKELTKIKDYAEIGLKHMEESKWHTKKYIIHY